jgi:acetylornithine/succinyldiaminopimelate/putrescine aminotransferase/predicted amino acid dehydrogenase
MSTFPGLNEHLKKKHENATDDYGVYARPLTARLLEAMNLAKAYTRGQGDYLYYDNNQQRQRVLDLTGGYGSNLLGHRHPRLLNALSEWNSNGAPSMTQGSQRKASGELAKKLSEILQRETSEGPWVTNLSNSGTEAIEAAIKHSQLHFKHKLTDISQEIEKEMNQALIKVRRSEPALQRKILLKLKTEIINKTDELRMSEERRSYLLHQLANTHDIDSLVSLLREINGLQINQRPKFISLKKAYHGKTLGALSITSNENFRNDFFLGDEFNTQTIFISAHDDLEALEKIIEGTRQDLIFIAGGPQGIVVTKHAFSLVAGAFAEPIQGEAGVIEVPSQSLAILKKFSLQENFLLIFDEIQSGMFRTGLMAAGNHSHITADVYTFSKSLGGGIAKIAATTILKRKYIDDFGFLHSSTFAEDDFSSLVALEVLNILESEESPLKSGMETAVFLRSRLEWLKSQFPEIIKEIRGKGLFLAMEFEASIFRDMGFEFKLICDSKMQGYLVAAGLLNHENLRMNPSLSNNLTLRIQPSLYFNMVQTEEMIGGLFRMCTALQNQDVKYFLTAIYPGEVIQNTRTNDLVEKADLGKRPLTVFLCHMINEGHIRNTTKALKELPDHKLVEKLTLTKDLAEFEIYHHQVFCDKDNQKMDFIMLGVPLTSEELKKTFISKNKYKVVKKVQNAIDYAKELGATTVGLGQFTSIVSGNGLYLDPRGMNLTTGNAYTISLTIQAALRSVEEKGTNLSNSTVALIGAAGNIMSVASSIMADKVGKAILIHHSPLESSNKFQEALRRILSDIANSSATSKVVNVVKSHWKKDMNLLSFMDIPAVKEVLIATSDLTTIAEADVVLSGTSSSAGFLTLDLFKQNAVIVDIAVPPTIKKELLNQIELTRSDLTYHLGGIAQFPRNQSLDCILFPLGKNESYACMAETFSIGFSGKKNFLNIGDLNKDIVLEVEGIAKEAGFILGKNKTSISL